MIAPVIGLVAVGVLLYVVFAALFGSTAGVIAVAVLGLIGFLGSSARSSSRCGSRRREAAGTGVGGPAGGGGGIGLVGPSVRSTTRGDHRRARRTSLRRVVARRGLRFKNALVRRGDVGPEAVLGCGARRAEYCDARLVDPLGVVPLVGHPAPAGFGGVAPAKVAFQLGHGGTVGAARGAVGDTIGSIAGPASRRT